MGSASSKASRAAGAAKRQYPQRVPPPGRPSNPGPAPRSQGPSVYPAPQASEARNQAVDRDARDPDFAASLRSLGPVSPSPGQTLSPSSSTNYPGNAQSDHVARSREAMLGGGGAPLPAGPNQTVFPSRDAAKNPAIRILQARTRIAAEAEEELANAGRPNPEGKRYLDVIQIKQVLRMRDDMGLQADEIERRLELRQGTVARLGKKGIVGDVR